MCPEIGTEWSVPEDGGLTGEHRDRERFGTEIRHCREAVCCPGRQSDGHETDGRFGDTARPGRTVPDRGVVLPRSDDGPVGIGWCPEEPDVPRARLEERTVTVNVSGGVLIPEQPENRGSCPGPRSRAVAGREPSVAPVTTTGYCRDTRERTSRGSGLEATDVPSGESVTPEAGAGILPRRPGPRRFAAVRPDHHLP